MLCCHSRASQKYSVYSCLDRTNVAQFSAGVEAIGQQLVVMGIRSRGKLGPSSPVVRVLIELYVDIGDIIALQYGGSEAHKKVTAGVAESNITGPIGKVRLFMLVGHVCLFFPNMLFLYFAAQRAPDFHQKILQQRLYRSTETRRNVRVGGHGIVCHRQETNSSCLVQELVLGVLSAIPSPCSTLGNGK
jgi:hypothetical protein